MGTPRRFSQVDVFTTRPTQGNPLAVVHDAEGLTAAQMAAFARWTNLSETAFLLGPDGPGADYRVRIFTPAGELPFAGHPTLGSCHAWLEAGGRPTRSDEVIQACGVGPVRIRREGAGLAFAAPPCRQAEVEAPVLAAVLGALGLEAPAVQASRWLENGPRWLALLLRDAATVLSLRPDHGRLRTLAEVGVIAPRPPGAATRFEVRAFTAASGIEEDPVTGSLNAGLAQWLIGAGLAPPAYLVSQGTALGRAGLVRVRQEGGTTWVGGEVVTCVTGVVTL